MKLNERSKKKTWKNRGSKKKEMSLKQNISKKKLPEIRNVTSYSRTIQSLPKSKNGNVKKLIKKCKLK